MTDVCWNYIWARVGKSMKTLLIDIVYSYFLLEQILSCLSWCKNSAESGRVILFFTTIGLIGMYISALSFLFAERTRSGFTSAR